jgi:hypothetical protein
VGGLSFLSSVESGFLRFVRPFASASDLPAFRSHLRRAFSPPWWTLFTVAHARRSGLLLRHSLLLVTFLDVIRLPFLLVSVLSICRPRGTMPSVSDNDDFVQSACRIRSRLRHHICDHGRGFILTLRSVNTPSWSP